MKLTKDQSVAVDRLCKAKRGGLVGRAGTGKSVTASGLVATLRAEGKQPILTAPTHKAARVLASKTDESVQTIHSLLSLVPLPNYEDGRRVLQMTGEPEFHPSSVIVIDEASMLTPRILDIIEGLGVGYILIGDTAQLPPVGFTKPVFTEWLKRKGNPVIALTQILRQAGDNPLPTVAEGWRPGNRNPRWPTEDVLGREGGVRVMRRPEAIKDYLAHAEAHHKAGEPSDTVRPWLAYTNAATQTIGGQARMACYGAQAAVQPFIEGELMLVGNPVVVEKEIMLQTSSPVRITSHDPIPGDITMLNERWPVWTCTITEESTGRSFEVMAMQYEVRKALLDELAGVALALMKSKAGGLRIREAWEAFHEMENGLVDLRTVYASTVHKSQGSGYTDVFIDKVDLLNRNAEPILNSLVYTAMTRATGTAIFAR